MLDTLAPAADADRPTGPVPTVLEGIVRRLCVRATYNRDWIVIAPHILYTRHGELYVDGVTVARNGMLPREERLGSFKIAGLGDPTLTGRSFERNALYEAGAERYVGVTLMAVED